MKKRLYYSIQNGGDGSAYPAWMESKELAEWDQANMDEGWGEPCCGYIEVLSDSEITFNEKLITIEDLIEEREEDLKWDYLSDWRKTSMKREIEELKEMKENRI